MLQCIDGNKKPLVSIMDYLNQSLIILNFLKKIEMMCSSMDIYLAHVCVCVFQHES